MGWIHIDTNTVSAIGRLIFHKRERFEDFWTLNFTNRSDVMSAYAQNVTAANQPIVFTNNTSSANVGNIKIHIFEETTFGTTPVGDNFSWSSSGTNVNVAANGTYNYQGVTHTSIADEFYYDGTSHGVSPYSGTLNGAHSYRIQFIYTDTATGKEYLSDFYDFGSHYYYTQPFASFEQAIRGDVSLVFTASAPSGTYSLGERVVGTLTATNTYPYACTLGLNAPNGVSLSQSTFEDVASGATVSTTFSYVITEEDLYNGSKTFNFGGSIGNVSMNPININGQTVSCTVDTDSASQDLNITVVETSEPINGESYALGEHIEGTATILNDGNVTLYNIVVTNEMSGDEWTIPSLSPGQSSSPFIWGYDVTEADIIAQQLEIYITARGEDFLEDLWWFEGYCSCLVDDPNPSLYLQIEETSEPANGEYYVLGERIDYSFTVTNDGNITCDNQNTHFLCDLTANDWSLINDLEPNNFVTFTDSYTVTEEDILKGYVSCDFYANAYMVDQEYYNFSSQNLELLVEDPNSEITGVITMDDEFSTYYDGQYVRNHIVITNTGNMTLTGIILTNEASGDEWPIVALKPGDSASFETETEIIYNSSTDSSFVIYEIEDATDPEGNTYTTTIQKELPTEMEPSNPCELIIRKHYQQIDGTYTVLGDVYTLNYGDTYKIPTDLDGFTASVNPVQGTLYEDTEVDVYYTRNYYPLTIYYKYEKNNTTAYQTYQQDYLYQANYSIESPIIPGYIPNKDVIEGKMWSGGRNEIVKYYFSNQYYRLIIRYYQLGLDGSYTLLTSGSYAPVTRFIEHGGTYNIISPSMTNYTPDPSVVSGVLNENKEINVYYDRPRHQLTIHYYMQQSDGTYVLDDNKTFSQWYWEGSSYNETTKPITGYTPDINRVTGSMGNQDIIMDVHYNLITYSFTVHYVKSSGPSAHPDITVTGTILDSDKYIISPAVEGYQATTAYVRWHPGSSSSQTVLYSAVFPAVSWAEITDGNYVTTSAPYPLTVRTTIDGQSSFIDDQDMVVFLQPFTIFVWSGCNVTVHWQGSNLVPSTWSSYNQEVSWCDGNGVYSKPYDNATDSFTIVSNNNIYASTDFTEGQ